jgi:magnesium chelatase subunit D
VNLPVSATEDRVVGTLDIEKAIKKGERHFEPGVLAMANRGLLYIDEVNLLDDHVVDILLDSAAMGVNIVEREGISFVHPARFILVGTMNPEEGDLRPQLLDRFALSVDLVGIRDYRERVQIIENNLGFEADPEKFLGKWRPQEQGLSERIARARDLVDRVTFTKHDLLSIAALSADLNVDGHRADLIVLKTARANAAFDGRKAINSRDIAIAAELAYPHRIRRGPFHQTEITKEYLEERIQQLVGERPDENHQDDASKDSEEVEAKKKSPLPELGDETPEQGEPEPSQQLSYQSMAANWWEGGKKVKVGEAFKPRKIMSQIDRVPRRQSGRRSQTRTERKRGRYIQARPAGNKTDDIAFDATLRAAAPYQCQRVAQRKQVAFAIQPSDLQRKVRVKRTANLVLFVVDASWSMAVAERMTATKGAILSLLTDAYQRRDRVGLVVFQKDRSILVLPPTNSCELAQRALANIPVGGKTPLSAGLYLALQVVQREKISHPDVMPLLILLTDGAGNVSMGSMPPMEEAYYLAEKIKDENIRSIVVNMEHTAFDQGLSQALADHLKAPCYTLAEFKADALYHTVRKEMEK